MTSPTVSEGSMDRRASWSERAGRVLGRRHSGATGSSADEAIPAAARRHRSTPTSGHDQHLVGAEAASALLPTYTWWQNLALAGVSLFYVAGITLGTMLVGGVVIHALQPSKSLDIFKALHDQLVVGVLLGLALFWMAPPYPWATSHRGGREAQDPVKSAGWDRGARRSQRRSVGEVSEPGIVPPAPAMAEGSGMAAIGPIADAGGLREASNSNATTTQTNNRKAE